MEQYYNILNSLNEKTFTEATEYISLPNTSDVLNELCDSLKECKGIDSKKLLILYLFYFFPNDSIEIHYPVMTFLKFSNVIKFTVNALNDYLLDKTDILLFEYYWSHFTNMLDVWITKDNFNLKSYLTYTFMYDKKDDILNLTKEDIGSFLLYDFWIEKKYKEMFNKLNLSQEIAEILKVINSVFPLKNFIADEVEDLNYLQNVFDDLIDRLNIRLLDIYYISLKKKYYKNICCNDNTFTLFTILAIIYLVPKISLKIGLSDKVNGWKNQLFGDQSEETMEL